MLKTRRSFRKEFKKQLRLAIVAAIGFTVAFAWRNAIYDAALDIVSRFTDSTQAVTNEIYTAFFITFLAVVLIFITSKILKDR